MKKKFINLFVFLVFALPSNGQKRNYNCIILDSIFSKIEWRKWHNDFLLPLFRSGEIKTDGQYLHRVTNDIGKSSIIDSVINPLNLEARTWSFLEDTLFSLDTFNVIIDTFHFFDNSCNFSKNTNYVIVDDYRFLDNLKKKCNVIIVQGIAYAKSGGVSIALRNTKSNFAIIFSILEGSHTPSPKVSLVGKVWYDPVAGFVH